MSYEYAKIPLREGLNIICGPNGSGKSSILLAVSVALGQAYTERGNKFSDLIRWGEDTARVTVTFNNEFNGGSRPIPGFETDYFRLSRYLKRDGDYWFEANFKPINKSEVVGILNKFGLNPDNMLIIMHQHMMMEFGITSPPQKLIMIEDAVGLKKYREMVLETQEKLTQVLSENESVTTLLQNAEETLLHWKGEYDRFLRRKELLSRKQALEREFAWSKLIQEERKIEAWNAQLVRNTEELAEKQREIGENKGKIKGLKKSLDGLQKEQNRHYYSLLSQRMDKTKAEEAIATLRKSLENADEYEKSISNEEKTKPTPVIPLDANNFKSGSKLGRYSDKIETLLRDLTALKERARLLKHDAEKLEDEKGFLEKLLKDEQNRKITLGRNKTLLSETSSLIEKISPEFDVLDKLSEQVTFNETQRKSLLNQLNRLISQLPLTIKMTSEEDPLKLSHDLLGTLNSELKLRSSIREEIKENKVVVSSLLNEREDLTASIRVHENEIEKLTSHQAEIHLCLEGKQQSVNIRCDVCGSLLTAEQWKTHLAEIEEGIREGREQLTECEASLRELQVRLSNKLDEQTSLLEEERVHDTLLSQSDQAKQLQNDITEWQEELNQHLRERDRKIRHIADLVDVEASHHVISEKYREIQAEYSALRINIPRLQEELSNFKKLYVDPQNERVKAAQLALETFRNMLPEITEQLKHYKSTLESALKQENERKAELDGKISDTQAELNEIETSIESLRTRYQDERAKASLIVLQREDVQREIDELKAEINHANIELGQIQPVVEEIGRRVETDRNPIDISSDIKVTMAHLALLSDVSEEVEKIYNNYLNVYKELEDKSLIVTENREKALEELEERKKVWRKLLQSLLGDVNPTFQSFLEPIGARGWVKLIDTEDVETAGIELIVGFKGATPQVLDSRTQSGGERSSATMAFLLALQRHIKSPFRAVDEFDVHMDPKNRETVSHMLLKEMEKETDTQYLTITPGQVTNVAEGVRIITVQNVMGKSEVQVYTESPRQEAVN